MNGNKLLLVLIAFFLLIVESTAQQAEIYIFRPKAYASAILNIEISINGNKVGSLGFGERLVYSTSNFGNQEIKFQMVNAKKNLSLEIEPNGVYYIETNMGMTKLKAELYEISAGRKLFETDTKFKKDSKPVYVNASMGIDRNEGESVSPEIATGTQEVETGFNESETSFLPSSQKRIALIIGNGDYQHGGYLRNPLNDAEDMSTALLGLGFEVVLVKDANLVELKSAIDNFGLKLSKYDVGLFYYAGHGIQTKGFNYFIPVDAQLKTEAQVEFNCVRTDRLLSLMESASNSTNIIILDACRNNPFERSWSRSANGSGLAFMDAPSGSFIAYATSPGRTASDGYGRNGLYTSALLQHIVEPNISIELMFKKVRETVSEKSGKAQIPWESTSLLGNFYFVSPNK